MSVAALAAAIAYVFPAAFGMDAALAADPVEFDVSGEVSAVVGAVDRDGDNAVDLTGDVNALVTAQGSAVRAGSRRSPATLISRALTLMRKAASVSLSSAVSMARRVRFP